MSPAAALRWRSAGVWLIPCAVCLAVFWPGLWAWFQRDDFAWLGLRLEVEDLPGFFRAMFAPMAQGTIRPWSERGFFMLFSSLFGLDALPYRLLVFATMGMALFLLSRVAGRLTGSLVGALAAPLFWGVNSSLATPLAWTSAYNQVMCAAFLLCAFWLWLRYAETGETRYYALQWAVFLAGFGALEINVVYPGIVIAWTVLSARWNLLKPALALVPASAAYFALHSHFAPKQRSGLYALHVDASMFSTLGRYWRDAFGGQGIENFEVPRLLVPLAAAAPWLLTAALAVYVAVSLTAAKPRRPLALFGFVWFLGTLAPVLPLRDHYSDYYLAIPTIGLSLAGADAVARAWAWRPAVAGAVALLLGALYVGTSAPVGRGGASYYRDRSQEAAQLVFGVERARQLHPGKTILLTDVSADLFWSAINDRPLRLLGIDNVYLAPGAEEAIPKNSELGDVDAFVFPAGQVRRLLDHDGAVVYSANGGQLRNVTKAFRSVAATRWKPTLARRVEVGNRLYADQLLEGWHKDDGGFRWMARQGALRVGGPGQSITVSGYAAKEILAKGPVRLSVTADGEPAEGNCSIIQPDASFSCRFRLPGTAGRREELRIVLALDKVLIPPGEDRELGVILGTVEIE